MEYRPIEEERERLTIESFVFAMIERSLVALLFLWANLLILSEVARVVLWFIGAEKITEEGFLTTRILPGRGELIEMMLVAQFYLVGLVLLPLVVRGARELLDSRRRARQ